MKPLDRQNVGVGRVRDLPFKMGLSIGIPMPTWDADEATYKNQQLEIVLLQMRWKY